MRISYDNFVSKVLQIRHNVKQSESHKNAFLRKKHRFLLDITL